MQFISFSYYDPILGYSPLSRIQSGKTIYHNSNLDTVKFLWGCINISNSVPCHQKVTRLHIQYIYGNHALVGNLNRVQYQ